MTILLDDIFSNKSKEALQKFSDFLRTFGDSVSKAKADPTSKEVERFDVCGTAVVTAEEDLNSQQSSRLRYLTTCVDNSSFNSEALRFFQNNRIQATRNGQPSVLQAYFSAYIGFLEENYRDIVTLIESSDQHVRQIAKKFPRLQAIYHVMATTIQIVLRFGVTYNVISPAEASQQLENWLNIIEDLILKNQRQSIVSEPYIAYLEALMHGIAINGIVIADSKQRFFETSVKYDGFYSDDNKLYLVHEQVFKYVEKYYSDLHMSFEATPNGINQALSTHGLSEGDKEKDRTRTLKKVSHGKNNSLRMLCLDYIKAQQVINSINHHNNKGDN